MQATTSGIRPFSVDNFGDNWAPFGTQRPAIGVYDAGMNTLPRKHDLQRERFCEEYVIDLDAKHAAIRAGYAPRGASVRACKLMKRADVQERIQRLLEERRARAAITADEVVRRLDKLATWCMTEVPIFNAKGEQIGTKPLAATAACRALELLGKSLALFVDRQQNEFDGEINLTWQKPVARDDDDFDDAGWSADTPRAPQLRLAAGGAPGADETTVSDGDDHDDLHPRLEDGRPERPELIEGMKLTGPVVV